MLSQFLQTLVKSFTIKHFTQFFLGGKKTRKNASVFALFFFRYRWSNISIIKDLSRLFSVHICYRLTSATPSHAECVYLLPLHLFLITGIKKFDVLDL